MISTCTEQHKPASPSRHLFPQPRENWGMRRYPAVVKNAPSDFLMARSTSTTGSRDAIGVGPIELARCVHGATRGTIRLMEFVTTNTTAHFVLFSLRRLGVYRLEAGRRGGDMDVTYPSARSKWGLRASDIILQTCGRNRAPCGNPAERDCRHRGRRVSRARHCDQRLGGWIAAGQRGRLFRFD